MELGVPKGGGVVKKGVLVKGQNALLKIATKQYLGRLMILEGKGWCRALYLT